MAGSASDSTPRGQDDAGAVRLDGLLTRLAASVTTGQPVLVPARLAACATALGMSGAAVTVRTDNVGGLETAWSTDATAGSLEDIQFTLREGPSIDAVSGDELVLEPDLGPDPAGAAARWPAFVPAAGELGVSAVFAFPLRIGAIRLGILVLYRAGPGRLTEKNLAGCLRLADVVTHLLLDVGAAEHGSLGDGFDHRAEVHQATGMISVQLGVSLQEALLRLRAYAFAHDRPLPDVAADVVSRRLRFGDPAG
jgi:hypothetical protein